MPGFFEQVYRKEQEQKAAVFSDLQSVLLLPSGFFLNGKNLTFFDLVLMFAYLRALGLVR